MFKSFILAASLATVNAWRRNVKGDKFQTEAYGADNQYYASQGYGGYGGYSGKGKGYGNSSYNKATSHNSYRQAGHQGQGHNQWVDNAWNQWGTNNHFDTQKSVDNKWGNQSGKINVNINSVSGHYDADYGQQQRGIGYEGHQNVSGAIGYTIGLGGHSFGYAPGKHSYGYDNREDYGYGGWANNLGAWNHGANYDNLGNQFRETGRDQYNDVRDRHDVKENRRVGAGYGDLDELDADDDRQDQYANIRVGVTNRRTGTRNTRDQFSGTAGDVYGRGTAGRGVDVAGLKKGDIYDGQDSYGYGAGYGSYGYGGYGGGYGGYGAGAELNNGVAGRALGSYNDSGLDKAGGYGAGAGYGGYGKGYGGRPLGGSLNGRRGGKW
jgi:hypothetical protein